MKISDYKTLICSLPVRQQCFSTKRSTWEASERKFGWLSTINDRIFENQKTVTISRQDIFDTENTIQEVIIKTIYWGYTRGMRGIHFNEIMHNISDLETILQDLKSGDHLDTQNFNELIKAYKKIYGLGLSTFSKLLYFSKIKFNKIPCLILDQRLIDVFANEIYTDYLPIKDISYFNAEKKYLDYLDITYKLSVDLNTHGENIEQFLFIFGNNLKTGPESKEIKTKR
jgi:hypothetical protein